MRLQSWARAIGHGKRGLCYIMTSLNFIQRKTQSDLYFEKTVCCMGKELEQGEGDSKETDQLAGLNRAVPFVTRNMKDSWQGYYTSTYPKILLVHFKILEISVKCKFHSTYISIYMQIFKIYAYVKPICLRSIWKILAENTDKFLIIR